MLRATFAVALLVSFSACDKGRKKLKPDTAASVVAFAGKVQFAPAGGVPRDAVIDDELKADDGVSVPTGGFALLQLAGNGHVVRIDEELSLKVKELALFGAPKTEVSLKSQLDALLSAAEKKGLNERMSGFYATAAAAETRGADRESKQVMGKSAGGGGAPPGAPPPSVASAPPRPPSNVAPKVQAEPSPPPPSAQPEVTPTAPAVVEAKPEEPEKPKSAEAPAKPAEVKPAAGGPAAPLAWPTEEVQAELRACLLPALQDPNVRAVIGDQLTVQYRRRGGELRLALEGALPVPRCATVALGSAPANETWRSFELSL